MTARRLIVAVLLSVATAFAVAPVGAANAAPAKIQITGEVTDQGGFPLPGVTVEVIRADREESSFAPSTTFEDGSFGSPRIPVDAATKYQLLVTDTTGRHRETVSAAFAATKANAHQDVTMAGAAIIRGKVTTKIGANVQPADVLVTALRVTKKGVANAGAAFTSSKGTFSVGGLPAGTYRLLIEDIDEDGTKPGPRFRSICFDNTLSTSSTCKCAATLTVKTGQVRTITPQVMKSPVS